MKDLSGNCRKLVLAAYLLAWLSPALWYLSADFRIESGAKVLVSLLFFCAWHLAFKNFLRAVYYSLFFFFLLPFDLFFFYIYREPPGTPVLLSMQDSNMIEAADFMRGRGMILLCAVVFALGVWMLTVKAAQRGAGKNWRCYNRTARFVARPLLVSFMSLLLLFATAPVIEKSLMDAGHYRLAASVKMIDENAGAPLANLRAIFPVGRLVSMGEYYREDAYLQYADQSKALFRYNARQADPPGARQIYVLVIGETARADRFALNGYTRNQPSFLAGQENVIPLSNIVSPYTYTNLSVPAMLTPSASGPDDRRDHAKSLVSAFREAGFKTYWISNQQPMGMRETEISHYSREADEAVFMNLSMRTMHQDGLYDEHMLVPLAQFLDRKEPKQFFVLHLLGAHDSYQRRYPPGFDIFKPSLRSLDNPDHHDRRNKLAVSNSYDNAMHYTDFVLARIIETIRKENAIATLIYSADHGETLFDGECQRSGHGSSGKQEFPVAAMIWVSNEYKAQWPDRFERLAMHALEPVTTEYILPTALDIAAIDADQLDRSRSLASPAFRAQTRWVNAPERLDWDTATTRGACNLLVSTKAKDKAPVIAARPP